MSIPSHPSAPRHAVTAALPPVTRGVLSVSEISASEPREILGATHVNGTYSLSNEGRDDARLGDRIRPYEKNPRYWQYRGEPVLLLGGSKAAARKAARRRRTRGHAEDRAPFGRSFGVAADTARVIGGVARDRAGTSAVPDWDFHPVPQPASGRAPRLPRIPLVTFHLYAT